LKRSLIAATAAEEPLCGETRPALKLVFSVFGPVT
jgi:hypothetical protein